MLCGFFSVDAICSSFAVGIHSSPIQELGNPEFWGCDEKCQETHRCEKKV
jgi:hypothetical protein